MATYQKVATTSEIPPGGRKALVLGDRAVLLVRLEDRFVAVEDLCSHDGQPLTDGPLEGTSIECPRHGAKFDLCTGKALCMPAVEPIATYEVRVEGSDVFIRTDE